MSYEYVSVTVVKPDSIVGGLNTIEKLLRSIAPELNPHVFERSRKEKLPRQIPSAGFYARYANNRARHAYLLALADFGVGNNLGLGFAHGREWAPSGEYIENVTCVSCWSKAGITHNDLYNPYENSPSQAEIERMITRVLTFPVKNPDFVSPLMLGAFRGGLAFRYL